MGRSRRHGRSARCLTTTTTPLSHEVRDIPLAPPSLASHGASSSCSYALLIFSSLSAFSVVFLSISPASYGACSSPSRGHLVNVSFETRSPGR